MNELSAADNSSRDRGKYKHAHVTKCTSDSPINWSDRNKFTTFLRMSNSTCCDKAIWPTSARWPLHTGVYNFGQSTPSSDIGCCRGSSESIPLVNETSWLNACLSEFSFLGDFEKELNTVTHDNVHVANLVSRATKTIRPTWMLTPTHTTTDLIVKRSDEHKLLIWFWHRTKQQMVYTHPIHRISIHRSHSGRCRCWKQYCD